MKKNIGYLTLIVIVCVFLSHSFRGRNPIQSEQEIATAVAEPASFDTKLHINELQLGMSRNQVNLLPSIVDGRKLGETHSANDSTEMYGHIGNGINSCSWVRFSAEDRLVGIRGGNLFLEGKPLEVTAEGTIPILGPHAVFVDPKGTRVLDYTQYSLQVTIDEAGIPIYTLGTLDGDKI